MKASVVHWVVHEILSILYFCYFSNGRGSHCGWSICEKNDINMKQAHLQIIMIDLVGWLFWV